MNVNTIALALAAAATLAAGGANTINCFIERDRDQVMQRTHETGWYAEELFARFAVVGAQGTYDGRPLAVGSSGR